MVMTDFEIAQHWRLAKARDPFEIRCLADLNAVSRHEMEAHLEQLGLYKPVKRVIDYAKAEELIRAGLRDCEVAKALGVGRSTIARFRIDVLGIGMRPRKGVAKPVLCVETGEIFETGAAAAKAVGRSPSAVSSALCGKIKTAGGYHWQIYEGKHDGNDGL